MLPARKLQQLPPSVQPSPPHQRRQALQRLPDNAGPLNTQRLLLQALTLMHEASPAYLQHFMAHAETLLWLEAASPARVLPRKEPARARRSAPR